MAKRITSLLDASLSIVLLGEFSFVFLYVYMSVEVTRPQFCRPGNQEHILINLKMGGIKN